MKIIRVRDAEAGAKLAAGYVYKQITAKANSVLGLPTGSTPLGLYRELIRMHSQGLSFKKVTTFNLDEYLGVAANHPASFSYFMYKNLFEHIDIPVQQINIPNGQCQNVAKECADYEQKINLTGGIDLQILGIGSNGHLGFNEPGTALDSDTAVVTLSSKTLNDNARFLTSLTELPTQAITMGLQTIMRARQCLLLAFGERKAAALNAMINGPVTSSLPASVLQQHPDCTIIIDHEAANLLN